MVTMRCLMHTWDWVIADCWGITSVTLPDSLTNLGSRAFDDRVKLGPPTHPLLAQKKEDEGDNED